MDFVNYLSEKHNIFLNEQQQKAVLNIEGPILLLAVPGGGKTTVIVSRCANMILNHKIKPEKILTLTFSKASALDMRHRCQKVFGSEAGSGLNFSTIHSFCYNVIRTYTKRLGLEFPVLIEDENAPITKSKILRQLYQKHNGSFLSDDKLEELSNSICYVKNMMIPDDEIADSIKGIKNFYGIFKSYEDYKTGFNYIDYDDMLTRTLELFKQNEALINAFRSRYTYINVDESQDTSFLQHQIIKCVAAPKNNIFMVGDEDQSIYTFRAAFPRALLDFEKTYPGAKVYLMENNYRSTKNIVSAANVFIKQNRERYNKNMYSEKDEGEQVKYTRMEEKNNQYGYIGAQLEKENDLSGTAVLYRNNVSVIPLADVLHRLNIPFYLREAKNHFFIHWVTVDIISFMNLSLNAADSEAFMQIYYKMNAYLTKAMAEYAVNNGNSKRSLFDVLLECPDINAKHVTRLLEINWNIQKISKLNALEAIDFIVKVIGYGEYLKKQSSNESETTDGLMQIISGLKSIAAKVGSIIDFKNRLYELQQIMNNARFNKGKNAVTLSTIHSSKGLEFDKVFIIDLFEGQFPSAGSISEFNLDRTLMEEEVRLFYVGATRARFHLELMSANMLDGKKVKPSRFIEQFLSVYKSPAIKSDNSRWGADSNGYTDGGPVSEKDLYLEMPVAHRKFGMGSIRFINPKSDLLEIFFENIGLKTFSLKACISGNLIHSLKPKGIISTES